MIKMFIGSDEVVSNKEFTINEEMLSASSTILNNCYPRSWELTRDYVSNFYYPKDYSKFILGQGDFIHGDTEYSVLEASGKNLFNKLNVLNGVFYSIPDGSILETSVWSQSDYIQIDNTKKYTISSTYTTANNSFELTQYDKNKVWLKSEQFQMRNGYIIFGTDILFEEKTQYIKIGYRNDRVNTNTVQLEEGTAKTPYQDFGTNVSFNTNIEKQWNTFNVYGKTTQETRSGKNLFGGKTFTYSAGSLTSTYNIEGSILLNGSYSGTGTYYTLTSGQASQNNMLINLSSGTYALSVDISEHPNIQVVNSSGGAIYTLTNGNTSGTFTLNADTNIFVRIAVASGSSFSNVTYKIQLEKSSSATTWEAFGVQPSPDYPSELVSVGYHNLLKNTNVNSGDNNYWQTYSTFDEATRTVTRSTTGTTEVFIYHRLNGLKSGKTYTLTLYAKSNGYVKSMEMYVFNQNVQGIRNKEYNITNEFQKYILTFTTDPNVDYSTNSIIRIDNNGSTTSGTEAILTVKDVCLVESDKSCDYVDYGKYGIQIDTTGANLYEPLLVNNGTNIVVQNATGTLIDDEFSLTATGSDMHIGQIASTGNKYSYDRGKLIDVSGISKLYFLVTNSTIRNDLMTAYDENFISLGFYSMGGLTTGSIDIPNGAKYVSFRFGYNQAVSGTTYKFKVMISKQPITEYQKYVFNTYQYVLNEPLRAINNYADRLYIQNKTLFVERRIKSVIFNGSEAGFYTQRNTSPYLYGITINDYLRVPEKTCMCNYFIGVVNGTAGSTTDGQIRFRYYTDTDNSLYFCTSQISTLNDFKTWLGTHNTKVDYVLANPITEPIGYIDVPTSYEGWNNVDLSTGLTTGIDVSYYWRNFNVIFSGVVKNSGDISLNPRYPHYCSLQVLDYKTFLSESNTLDFVISNKTIREAIGMVVNAVSEYGFSVGTIDIDKADEVIGAYSTLNKTAYDVLQYLAEISGSKWRTRPLDSTTMAIDFYDPDLLPQSNDILYTQEYWEDNNIVDMTFNYGTRDYRNKQIMLSNEVYANIDYIENLVSNGYNNTYVLQGNVATITSVLVDGEEKTVATTNDKNMGIDADFYFTPGRNTLESNSTYSAGTEIDITYTPLVKGRQIVYNADEVDRISLQTDTEGVIARYESRNDVLSSDELEKIAQTYIKYKGKPEVILKITTENKDLFQIGEVAYFDAPIADLKQDYMVKSKETQYIINSDISESKNLFFVYELTSSFNAEKAINYFDNQRNKASGNISEGESITRNIDIENTAKIIWTGATIEQTSVTIVGDNTLNCALNSPLIN